jgi:ABC-type transport system involved in Fe-S cluster assembly fused permease/ATPase subunit
MPKNKPYQYVLSEIKLFLIINIPISFIVSGGIATIIGHQEILTFLSVFIWFILFQFRIFEWIIQLDRKYEEIETKKREM